MGSYVSKTNNYLIEYIGPLNAKEKIIFLLQIMNQEDFHYHEYIINYIFYNMNIDDNDIYYIINTYHSVIPIELIIKLIQKIDFFQPYKIRNLFYRNLLKYHNVLPRIIDKIVAIDFQHYSLKDDKYHIMMLSRHPLFNVIKNLFRYGEDFQIGINDSGQFILKNKSYYHVFSFTKSLELFELLIVSKYMPECNLKLMKLILNELLVHNTEDFVIDLFFRITKNTRKIR